MHKILSIFTLIFLIQNFKFCPKLTISILDPIKSIKAEKILKGMLNSIPSPSPSVKIQIMGGKVCLRCKGKALLGDVNKLFKTKSLLTSPINAMFCLINSSKFSCQWFEFLLKVQVMGSNPDYLIKSFLLYKILFQMVFHPFVNCIDVKCSSKQRAESQKIGISFPSFANASYLSKVEQVLLLVNVKLIDFLTLFGANQQWYFVTKIVLTYCEKKLFQ